MRNSGWIKTHRSLRDWEWYKDQNMKGVFLDLLMSANHKPAKWKGHNLSRGELITSLENLAFDTGLTVSKVRTALKKLQESGEIIDKGKARFRLITIVNYNSYQGEQGDSEDKAEPEAKKESKAKPAAKEKPAAAPVEPEPLKTTTPPKTFNPAHPVTPTAADELKAEFERVWIDYGRKGSKKISKSRYLKLSKEKRLAIAEHLPKYFLAKPDEQYRRDFERYISNEVWNDKLIYPQQQAAPAQPVNTMKILTDRSWAADLVEKGIDLHIKEKSECEPARLPDPAIVSDQ